MFIHNFKISIVDLAQNLYHLLKKKWFKRTFVFTILVITSLWYFFILPNPLFNDSTSTLLLDRNGQFLGAKIADDGQWRFSAGDSVPMKFEICLLEFEDKNFYKHLGISARGIARSVKQNFKKGKIVSGGSTITMQLARIMRKNPPRTYPEKIYEMILATRLELKYSKKEILGFYAANAPFGNNVVGLEAASWRYFGRGPEKLSWAECATLAVLPNAPGLIYPGKNHQRLLEKRNRLLKKLNSKGLINNQSYKLALSEPLPDKPLKLHQHAPHLLASFIMNGYKGKTIKSTIDINFQIKARQKLALHSSIQAQNQVFNGAIIITDVNSGDVLAYIGNTESETNENENFVDCITSPRSTGSILKPLLFLKSVDEGIIGPNTLLMDIPTFYGSFSPKNFAKSFDGAVPAAEALSRSLNIPMVKLLNEYGLEKFHNDLKVMGISTLNKPARHYGLSLILGGAEATLFDLNSVYTHLAQKLKFNSQTRVGLVSEKDNKQYSNGLKILNRAAIYSTFNAMTDVNRPDEEGNWRVFNSSQKIAWKTGTSFGFRDAWSIGITPNYVVSVWVGNADGEGRPGLTGVKSAAPLLFDIFSFLPKSRGWFIEPRGEMTQVVVCRESGLKASENCDHKDTILLPKPSERMPQCNYHKIFYLSKDGKFRVDSDCESVFNMVQRGFFVLPPLVEKFYKPNHPNYKSLPKYRSDCKSKASDKNMTVVYPKNGSVIYVPTELDGSQGKTIFEATHRNAKAVIYWHLDDQYLGQTSEIHQVAINPGIGHHKLNLIDEDGYSVVIKFEVIK